MIIFHGSLKRFDHFSKDVMVQNFNNDIDTIGYWFTSVIEAAKPFAFGTEMVHEKSETEFWDDGEPKVLQVEREVHGFIYKVYLDEADLKVYNAEDSYDAFMRERDKFCDYLGSRRGNMSWKDGAILLNKVEANAAFRKHLMRQSYDGLVIRNTSIHNIHTDLYCIFSEKLLPIIDVVSVDDI
ncbi:hypothetical protein [Bacillus dakarensis]|uniref:hypothetical protein n=1 Tax=Robertmurraya dakarensis TaxID=1926278 RepID=UPI000980C49E|nr:hypothetical protein [Bacillus dakarensis]